MLNAFYHFCNSWFLFQFQTPSTSVQDIINAVDVYLIKSTIPQRLIGAQCPVNGTVFNQVEFEDFVLPNRPTYYRIHPFYLRMQPVIRVQVGIHTSVSLCVVIILCLDPFPQWGCSVWLCQDPSLVTALVNLGTWLIWYICCENVSSLPMYLTTRQDWNWFGT